VLLLCPARPAVHWREVAEGTLLVQMAHLLPGAADQWVVVELPPPQVHLEGELGHGGRMAQRHLLLCWLLVQDLTLSCHGQRSCCQMYALRTD
jgi:hypothetical protein